ncbi:MAG: CHASE2 domain-containing protein [Hyphomonadaceae bacterium]
MPTPLLPRFMEIFRQWPAILAAACVLAVDVFDSFGLDQQADEQAARIIGTVTAPFYGGEGRPGQQAVTVVLIDDASLEYMNWPTPLPYDVQGDIVSALAAYEPAAIFFDFSYLRPHGQDPEGAIRRFADRVKLNAANGGPEIMIGEVGQGSTFAPLRELRSVGVAWHEDTWLNYPMQDRRHVPMAAVALYNAWCARHEGECAPNWTPPQVADDQRPRRMSLTWGFGASTRPAELSADPQAALAHECVMRDTSFGTRASVSFRESVGALGREFFNSQQGGDTAEARCIYTDTFNAATLLVGNNMDAVEHLVRGRVVLVGASHRQSADLQAIPGIGVVPGVYVHAMAVDNLIEYGPNYHRPPPDGFLDLDYADVVEILLSIALFCMVLLLVRELQKRLPGGSDAERRARRRWLWVGGVVLAVVFVFGAAGIEYALHWPPLNVVGVILLVAVVFSYLERHENRLAQAPSGSDNLTQR